MDQVTQIRDIAKALAVHKMRQDLEDYQYVWLLTYRRPMSVPMFESLKEAYRAEHLPIVVEALVRALRRRANLEDPPTGPDWLYEGF